MSAFCPRTAYQETQAKPMVKRLSGQPHWECLGVLGFRRGHSPIRNQNRAGLGLSVTSTSDLHSFFDTLSKRQKVIAVSTIETSEVAINPSAAPKLATNAPITMEPSERIP